MTRPVRFRVGRGPSWALLAAFCLLLIWTPLGIFMLVPSFLLALAALPMTLELVRNTGRLRYLAFLPFAMVRALARGIGLKLGVLGALFKPRGGEPDPTAPPAETS